MEKPLTAVSDQLLANNLVGYWTCQFYNNNRQYVTNNVGLFPDYSMRAELYLNNIHQSTAIEVWAVQNGHFINTDLNGFYFKYNLQFYGKNEIRITFVETNGIPAFPVGTVFIYTRYQP